MTVPNRYATLTNCHCSPAYIRSIHGALVLTTLTCLCGGVHEVSRCRNTIFTPNNYSSHVSDVCNEWYWVDCGFDKPLQHHLTDSLGCKHRTQKAIPKEDGAVKRSLLQNITRVIDSVHHPIPGVLGCKHKQLDQSDILIRVAVGCYWLS